MFIKTHTVYEDFDLLLRLPLNEAWALAVVWINAYYFDLIP